MADPKTDPRNPRRTDDPESAPERGPDDDTVREESEETELIREDEQDRPATRTEQNARDAREAAEPPDSLARSETSGHGNTGDPQAPRTYDKREDTESAEKAAVRAERFDDTAPSAPIDAEEHRVRPGDRKRGREGNP
jgi:hypothetical protein